ncbi:ubiquitin-like domain containing protein [Ordospora colligata]|uniref:Ubiquitin-like domain containing protein n=1 Tax=Ordospora colligata OC4 TaxID=1354746 RepID=A0A0B2UHX0_9MICR|nr:ubiquitin-like domain containing protein [Ordospora colligata OC4]KHN68789.1 ubiquitin-like domain containing protein [Ordospora colligata OC4]TBU13823.1 ubiquitin-like domain containing protein [Ordospora colligata]TBU14012.1 ubiquitin-like domain containing protein [Ordospora colligata]TBU17681.1 ubiquitin-like domain containing protein [Ordospora colligata]
MIVKAINCEDLYIDDQFNSIDELKHLIKHKYGIAVESQCIVPNGRLYILGIFDNIHVALQEEAQQNPFAQFGCPDSVFNTLRDKGMNNEVIEKYILPHKQDTNPTNSISVPQVNIQKALQTALKLNSSQYFSIKDITKSIDDEVKKLIIENTKQYIQLIINSSETDTHKNA